MTNNIYIHVPFCMSKCNYCAFFSRACAVPDWGAYAAGIISEIQQWHNRMGKIPVDTVFFGGGTPSLMPTDIFARIMDEMRGAFDIAADAEITIEANPATIDSHRLAEFIAAGVNRLSVGVQSFDDHELRFLGRRHTAHDAYELLHTAMATGIRVSADFIYGMPGHRVENIQKLCRDINSLGLTHCSMYELTIEPGTPFYNMNLDMPDNNTMADMYCAITDNLAIPRYEVSNYARPGFECRHNMNVWDGDMYIGIGTGAAGRVLINGVWHEQTGGAAGTVTAMTDAARATERVITGLRTMRGVQMTMDVEKILNMDYIRNNPDLVCVSNGRVRATDKGLLILDDLLINLVR